jgi:hypothetical protein
VPPADFGTEPAARALTASERATMKLFECQHCGQPLYFENVRCESCGRGLGYLPAKETISALEEGKRGLRALAERKGRYRHCANFRYGACNWLVPVESPEQFCLACRHNRMIPDLSLAENQTNWMSMEFAKHRLFYTLLKLRLPLQTKVESPGQGLAFDFLAQLPPSNAQAAPVMTGHDNGLITINIAEADDAERERMRRQMGEPYRTLLGHFRHEIAHYYWDRLVRDAHGIEAFRQLFGDEREDYGAALQRHYANGPPPDWQQRFVSPYASTHPWEDWAETWAHYFHMVDTLETGVRVRHEGQPTRDPRRRSFDRGRLRSASRESQPHCRGLAAADLRGQFDQPQHGHRRPLSVRAGAAGDR